MSMEDYRQLSGIRKYQPAPRNALKKESIASQNGLTEKNDSMHVKVMSMDLQHEDLDEISTSNKKLSQNSV